MDTSKIKNVIQKLIIQRLIALKNYSFLLLPVIITLIAGLLFMPTGLMSGKLKKRIADESVSMGKKVLTLSKNAVPCDQWKTEEEHQQNYQRDAEQIALWAKQSAQRQLLSYKIFPEPKGTSTLVFKEFGRQFRKAVDGLMSRVNARDCPTNAELNRSLYRHPGDARPSGKLSEVDVTIMDVLCQEKAESASVYANPADMSGYEFWEEYKYAGTNKAVEDCWYWQLSYWIIEDVIDTIESLNLSDDSQGSGSNNIFTSPVKRLMAVSFTTSDKKSVFRGKTVDDQPAGYVLSAEKMLTKPHTNRVCNDNVDVVHFRVIVVVGTKTILPFMQELCSARQHEFSGFFGKDQKQFFKHNQITILESKLESIDRESETHELYRYGEDAVVKLDLICEYVFDKNGYDEIKPESVKETLRENLND